MNPILPNFQITTLRPYQPGMSIKELARLYTISPSSIIKIASNENPLGFSASVLNEIKKALDGINQYPDQHDLIRSIADFNDMSENNIVLGNGSNDIIDLIARVYLDKNGESLTSEYAFIIYQLVSLIAGAKNVITPAVEFGHDLDGMLKQISPKTKVIWIANPNNPTGTFIDYTKLVTFLESVPPHIIVVLDEAYNEYLPEDLVISPNKLIEKFPNIIILRTFSKIYGLAGLRIGYGLSRPDIVNYLNRVRHPFNVNSLGIVAATAALKDQGHVARCREHNAKSLAYLQNKLKQMDIEIIPSSANFVTARFLNARDVHKKLLQQGVITRPLSEYGLPNHIRISVGTEQENERLCSAIQSILFA